MEEEINITPSQVIEYLYCPRFIYYMECLKISQEEGRRYKVQKGRRIHDKKSAQNKNYLRRKLGVKDKLINQKMSSKKYNISGEVDEVLFLQDGEAAPLDYKFAEYREKLFRTHKYQSVMYGMMIEENFNRTVNEGYIIYIRSRNKLKEIIINDSMREEVKSIIKEVINIIQKGFYPEGTDYSRRCHDCCYQNICIK